LLQLNPNFVGSSSGAMMSDNYRLFNDATAGKIFHPLNH